MKQSLLIALCIVPVLGLSSCRTVSPAAARTHRCEFDAQLLALPSCSATVEKKSPCTTYLTLHNGDTLIIGSPAPSPMLGRFAGRLEVGQTYSLPREFMKYAQEQKNEPKSAQGDGLKPAP